MQYSHRQVCLGIPDRARKTLTGSRLPSFSSRILSAGYFPKELPPPFSTRSLAEFADRHTGYMSDLWCPFGNKGFTTKLVRHNLARPGTNRRLLGIPNPINQWRLALAIGSCRSDIETITEASPLSSSKPTFQYTGRRAVAPLWYGMTLSEYRAEVRSKARFISKVDIARFYPSVYTHSIPWALHTKATSKAAARDKTLPGNVIDKVLREGQDGQTIGIPIGPDTSFMISELLLSQIDMQVASGLKGRGYRWYDDYEVGFDSEDEAVEFNVRLERALGDYELEVNAAKTEVLRLPQKLADPWLGPLQGFEIRPDGRNQASSLIDLFNRAFEFADQFPQGGVLKYAVRKLYKRVDRNGIEASVIHRYQWKLAQELICQVAVVEPDTLPTVLGILSFYSSQGMEPDLALVSETLNRVASIQAPRGFASDVAWAIWGYIENQLPVPDSAAQMAANMGDDVVSLLLLHARALGYVSGGVSFAEIEGTVSVSDFNSEHWLLAYESHRQGWLTAPVTNAAAADVHSSKLCGDGVHFYRTNLRRYESARHVFGTPFWMLGLLPYD